MGNKKMKLRWPSCKHPRTLSFRARDDIFKTVNSVFLDPCVEVETPESWFTNSSESASFSTESEDHVDKESLEIIVREARSERLFFEPGGETSSILEEAKLSTEVALIPFKESVVLPMDSQNPYFDFRRSMEEMVETYGLKEWACLEELLGWYLRVNGKENHGFIVDAFADLLVSIAATATNHHDSISYSSVVSSFNSSSFSLSPNLGSMKGEIQIDDDVEQKVVLL